MKILTLPAMLLVLFCVYGASNAFAQTAAAGGYCQTTYTYSVTSGDYINGVKFLTTDNQNSGQTTVSNPSPYKNYTFFDQYTAPVVVPSQVFTVSITNSPSWGQGQAVYVDWNGDKDFSDPGESFLGQALGSGATGTINVTVPANAVGGETRLRAICAYNTVPNTACGTQSFGECEDYKIIVSASPTISPGSPPNGKAGLPWEHTPSVTGGSAPYTWSITDRVANGAKNGLWVNIDPATGRLFGTPPSSVGNDVTAVRVKVMDAASEEIDEIISWFVGDVPSLPYFDDFEGDTPSTDYNFVKGQNVYLQHDTSVKAAGNKSLVFSSTQVSGWDLDALTAGDQLLFADDPSRWSGDTPDMKNYVGEFEFTARAADTKKVKLDLDMRMYSGSSSVIAKNAIFEYSEDFGQSWTPIVFANSASNGVIRYSSGNFSHESFALALSGNQEYFSFRVRSMIKYKHTSALPTYLSIDNLDISIPLQQTVGTELPDAQETAPYEVELTSAGGQLPHGNWAVTTGSLPTGVTIQELNGKFYLKATPLSIPTGQAGVHNFALEVKDGNGDTDTVNYSLEVDPAPPAVVIVNQDKLGSAGEGDTYSYILSANGGIKPYVWTLKSSNAAWLSLDVNTGKLSGAVPAAAAGLQVSATVLITDLIGGTFEKTYEFDIVNKIEMQSATLASGTASTSYRKRLVVLGGTPPYSYSLSAGSLPEGISLNALTGEFFGAPYRTAPGMYTFDVFIEDSGSQILRETVEFEILPAASNIFTILTPNTLPQSFEEVDFSFPFDATGGFPPYVWSAQPGSMPPGMSLSQDGRISGSPIAGSAKTYTVALTVTDAMNNTAQQPYTIEVVADPTFPSITTTANLAKARIGIFYIDDIKVEEGTAPFTWTVTDVQNKLPQGITATPTGDSLIISGRPLVNNVGIFSFEVKVVDANNFEDTKVFTMSVEDSSAAALQIIPTQETPNGVGKLQKARIGESFGYNFLAVGGAAPYDWKLSAQASAVPAGLQLNAFGALSGSPVNNTAGDHIFEVVVTDAAGRVSSKFFTLTVLEADDFSENSQADEAAIGSFNGGGVGGSCALNNSSSTLLWLLAMIPALLWYRRRANA